MSDSASSNDDDDDEKDWGAVIADAENKAAGDAQWECPQCTLLNDQDNSKCEVCDFERPSSSVVCKSGSSGDAAAAASAAPHIRSAINVEAIASLSEAFAHQIDALAVAFQAVSTGDQRALEALAARDVPVDVDSVDGDGNSLLMVAIQHKETGIALMILQRRPRVDTVNALGMTALHMACAQGLPSVVDALLRVDASAQSSVDARDAQGATPLILCVQNPDGDATLEIVRLLLDHAPDVDAALPLGAPPIDVDSSDDEGDRLLPVQNALSIAIKRSQDDVAKMLIFHAQPADARTRNIALIWAVSQDGDEAHDSNQSCIRALLSREPASDPNYRLQGVASLLMALKESRWNVALMLLEDPSKLKIEEQGEVPDSDHKTVWSIVFEDEQNNSIEEFLEIRRRILVATFGAWLLPAFEKLLSLGKDEFARQNAANEHFIDMLTKFCRQPYSSAGVEFVKYLLSLDATVDVTARDAAGLLPVHHAAQTGNFYLLKYLVTAYPQLDMYAKCPRGRTPLELAQAARRYQFEEVCMFFEKIDGQRSLRKQSIEAKLRFKSNCRVLEVLGAGNFGSVCKVTLADQSTDEVFAVKFLKPGRGFDELINETAAMQGLDHENVTRFVCLMADDTEIEARLQTHGLVMNFCAGGSLMHAVQTRQPFPYGSEEAFVRLATDMAAGLQHLHCRRPTAIVHRDVNLRNFLLDANGRCLISDFGLSRQTTMLHRSRQDEIPLSSSAPELLQSVTPTCKSDIWMLGFSWLHLLRAGAFPLTEDEESLWVQLVGSGTLETLLRNRIPLVFPSTRVEIPAWIRALVAACLCAQPQGRLDIDEVLSALRSRSFEVRLAVPAAVVDLAPACADSAPLTSVYVNMHMASADARPALMHSYSSLSSAEQSPVPPPQLLHSYLNLSTTASALDAVPPPALLHSYSNLSEASASDAPTAFLLPSPISCATPTAVNGADRMLRALGTSQQELAVRNQELANARLELDAQRRTVEAQHSEITQLRSRLAEAERALAAHAATLASVHALAEQIARASAP